jgi:hypothetical protein
MHEKSISDRNSISLFKIKRKRIMKCRPPNEKIIPYNLHDKMNEE